MSLGKILQTNRLVSLRIDGSIYSRNLPFRWIIYAPTFQYKIVKWLFWQLRRVDWGGPGTAAFLCQSSCFPFNTSSRFCCSLHLACSSLKPGPFLSFLVPDIWYVATSFHLDPSPPHPSSPRLMLNGGIPLQPPHRVLLFCPGRAHFMQHDYISLAISGGVFWASTNAWGIQLKL